MRPAGRTGGTRRYKAGRLNGEGMVRLEEESLNSLFEVLQEWETHLAQSDFDIQWCEDDTFAP